MSTVPIPIHTSILVSNTVLYTAFSRSPTTAMLVALDLNNTTNSDIQVNVFWQDHLGSTNRYLATNQTVPAKGTASWRGIVTLAIALETIQASGSATGVDSLGTVMET